MMWSARSPRDRAQVTATAETRTARSGARQRFIDRVFLHVPSPPVSDPSCLSLKYGVARRPATFPKGFI